VVKKAFSGPYVVKKAFSGGALQLSRIDGEDLVRPMNANFKEIICFPINKIKFGHEFSL